MDYGINESNILDNDLSKLEDQNSGFYRYMLIFEKDKKTYPLIFFDSMSSDEEAIKKLIEYYNSLALPNVTFKDILFSRLKYER